MNPLKKNPPQPDAGKGRAEAEPKNTGEGTNEVQHEPNPEADRLPDGQHRHVQRSPYTTGND